MSCYDANLCTDDACDAVQGCTFTPNTQGCDDGDMCTEGDGCLDGLCAGSAIEGCCPEGMVVDCLGGCTSASVHGNASCDDTLNCLALDFDEGDCESLETCGDATCDAWESCANCEVDCGVCPCEPGFVLDCEASCSAATRSSVLATAPVCPAESQCVSGRASVEPATPAPRPQS